MHVPVVGSTAVYRYDTAVQHNIPVLCFMCIFIDNANANATRCQVHFRFRFLDMNQAASRKSRVPGAVDMPWRNLPSDADADASLIRPGLSQRKII